jgi:hypothetical protein
MMPKLDQFLEEIENELMRDGLIPRKVLLGDEREARFSLKTEELWVFSPVSATKLPYFDPMAYSDAELVEKLSKYLLFT